MKKPLFKNISAILIWSENYKDLSDWYQQVFDLQPIGAINHPKDTGILFEVGNTKLWIGQHRRVKGKNRDIHRHMFNIAVDSLNEAYEYLKSKGVNFWAKPFKAPTMDKYFATFHDLDDNLVQIVGGE